MRLSREVRGGRASRAPTIVASIVVVAVLAMTYVGPQVMAMFGESYEDVALAIATKYASEAYPAWHAKDGGGCPPHLEVLNEYMNQKDIKDPWGHDYELYCGPHGIAVRSLGEDGLRNTHDDVWGH